MTFSDFQPAPNQGSRPDLYEIENRAIDPDGLRLEFPGEIADGWLASHPGVMSLTYGYVLFATTG